jgi:S1-C subfamily serine protease
MKNLMHTKLFAIFFIACMFGDTFAQTNGRWFNARLLEQGMLPQQREAIGKADNIQCQVDARSSAAQVAPQITNCNYYTRMYGDGPYAVGQCMDERDRRQAQFNNAQRDVYQGCMASKGWVFGVPPAIASPTATPQPVAIEPVVVPKNTEPTIASTGTGFFVSTAGHLLSNEHVIEGCSKISARLASGEIFPLSLVATDSANDLALLKAPTGGATATFRRGPAPLGERIVVYGFPLAGTLSISGNLTTGAISAVAGISGDPSKYQISAPIQSGNSGGAVLDESGLVYRYCAKQTKCRQSTENYGRYSSKC